MSEPSTEAVIGTDLYIQGEVRNGRRVRVAGSIDGAISADHVVVSKGGRIHGTLVANTAQIDGEVQGQIVIRRLIQIGSSGSVRGDVRYGSIEMQSGAELSADMRNVPPEIAGDLTIAVKRGQTARITTDDLTALDPDSDPDRLTFTVQSATGGFVARADAPATAVAYFTQAELQARMIVFVHDGSAGKLASFDVVVADDAGATSGAPQTVRVAVF